MKELRIGHNKNERTIFGKTNPIRADGGASAHRRFLPTAWTPPWTAKQEFTRQSEEQNRTDRDSSPLRAVWVRLLLEDCEEDSDDAEKNIWLPYSGARFNAKRRFMGGVMQNPVAEHYRKEAAKCHELAKFACPAYLGDVAMRYLSWSRTS
jgi:hypothetical protein